MINYAQRNALIAVTLSLFATSAMAQIPSPVRTGAAIDTARQIGSNRGGGILNSIFGCSSPGSKQVIGAAGGGTIGGLVGNRVAGKGKRTIGTVVGASVGAAAGSALGCKLQRNDQKRAEAAAVRAIETNQSQSWQNSETGASGTVDTQQSGPRLAQLTLAPNVQLASAYSGIGATYIAKDMANIRTSPSLEGAVIGQLAQSEQVWVAGAASDTGWLLISKNGVGQGYVSPSLLQREPSNAQSCKIVRNTVSIPGSGSEVQNLRACRNPDGNWAFSPVVT